MTFNAGIEAAALKPCPFCGGEPTVQPQGKVRQFKIYCGSEDCMGPQTTAFDEQDCIVQWNTRPSSSAPVEQREAIKAALREKLFTNSGLEILGIDAAADAILSLPGSSRDEVLEEAAKVAESKIDNHWNRIDVVEAIRALKSGVAK